MEPPVVVVVRVRVGLELGRQEALVVGRSAVLVYSGRREELDGGRRVLPDVVVRRRSGGRRGGRRQRSSATGCLRGRLQDAGEHRLERGKESSEEGQDEPPCCETVIAVSPVAINQIEVSFEIVQRSVYKSASKAKERGTRGRYTRRDPQKRSKRKKGYSRKPDTCHDWHQR